MESLLLKLTFKVALQYIFYFFLLFKPVFLNKFIITIDQKTFLKPKRNLQKTFGNPVNTSRLTVKIQRILEKNLNKKVFQ